MRKLNLIRRLETSKDVGFRKLNPTYIIFGRAINLLLVLVFLILQSSGSNAGWPFNRTPEIEGVITDATTGEPVENVIVACGWQKRVPSVGGDITSSFTGEVSVTGKDGKYKIPAKTTFHLLSSFGGMMVQVVHPLYETKMEYGDNTGIMVDHIPMNKSEDGIVHADVRMMGLRERYLGEVESGEWRVERGEGKGVVSRQSSVGSEEEEVTSHQSPVTSEEKKGVDYTGFWSYLGTHENGWYWEVLKEKGFNWEESLDRTLKVWYEIAARIDGVLDDVKRNPQGLYKDSYQRRVKFTEEKILKNIDGTKK